MHLWKSTTVWGPVEQKVSELKMILSMISCCLCPHRCIFHKTQDLRLLLLTLGLHSKEPVTGCDWKCINCVTWNHTRYYWSLEDSFFEIDYGHVACGASESATIRKRTLVGSHSRMSPVMLLVI